VSLGLASPIWQRHASTVQPEPTQASGTKEENVRLHRSSVVECLVNQTKWVPGAVLASFPETH